MEDFCREFSISMDYSESSTNKTPEAEKQKSLDPMSLKQSAREPGHTRVHPPLPLPPGKSKFLSNSLPSSATSSPPTGFLNLKKWRNQGRSDTVYSLARKHASTVSPFAWEVSPLRKSKSCGEGRTSVPYDEFDTWSPNEIRHTELSHALSEYATYEVDGMKITPLDSISSNSSNNVKNEKNDNFRCGALCLFLPGFAKGKPVRPRRVGGEVGNVISRTVSLEKFECGSWASSGRIMNEEGNGESMSLYFDLPLELIHSNVNDTHSPVASAFVFENDRKGVLKMRGAVAGKPNESSRHVWFSTSNPKSYPASPCPSPRLPQARDEFNAYLQAQGV